MASRKKGRVGLDPIIYQSSPGSEDQLIFKAVHGSGVGTGNPTWFVL